MSNSRVGGQWMSRAACRAAGVAAGLAAVAASAGAGFSVFNNAAPGGFVQVAVDRSTGSGTGGSGQDLLLYLSGPEATGFEAAFGGATSALRSVSVSDGSFNASAAARAGMGWMALRASNVFPNNFFFPLAAAHAGFEENFTVTNPALTGQQGFLRFRVNVSGQVRAAGPSGSGSVSVNPFVNDSQAFSNPHWTPASGGTPLSTDRQYAFWAIATFSPVQTETLPFNSTVTFALPFTFGTQFSAGIFAQAVGGMRSCCWVETSTGETSEVKVTWGGIVDVLNAAGTPVSGSTIASATSTNWGSTIVAPAICPGDLNNDNQVDNADFVQFVSAYNIFDCSDPTMPSGCPSDLNADGFVDAGDFVLFVNAYNDFVCP